MCGFVGYVLPPGAPGPALASWAQQIRHRGPDQAGEAQRATFGVATRRLSILDLSPAGSQPMRSPRFIVGFNGEIYNHRDIRAELLAETRTEFASTSDTETILRGIDAWGVDALVERLNGMYALAIYDSTDDTLHLARDPLGTKPLFFLERDGGVYFGSELKALVPFTCRRISTEGMALYLTFGFVPAPHSLVEGVRKVRAGEVVAHRDARLTSRTIRPRSWSVDLTVDPGAREEVVRTAVETAIERQLLSDVPTGIFLSGGVDSSIIASVLARHRSDVTSFSARPTERSGSTAGLDADLAAGLARSLGFRHREIPVDPLGFLDDDDAPFTWWDEPVMEPYFWAERQLARAARAEGVPVVLTGHGADEAFLGYPSYPAMDRGARYDRVPVLGPAFRAASHLPGLRPAMRDNLRGAASVWRRSFLEKYGTFSRTLFEPAEVAQMLHVEVAQVEGVVASVLDDTFRRVEQLPTPPSMPLRPADLAARMDLLLNVPEHYNMRLDRATMSASVEARVPFQDLELLNTALRIPATDMLLGGQKGLLKAAFRGALGEEVANRPKRNFQAPLVGWLNGPLGPWAERSIVQLDGGLELQRLRRSSHVDSPRAAYGHWSLALLQAWRASFDLEFA